MPIAERTRLLLDAAGWWPGRRVDVTDSVVLVKTEGYSFCAAAKTFLERFSGISVDVPHPTLRGRIRFEFHPSGATRKFDHEEILYLEERLGEELTPIGSYEGCYAVFMGNSGSVYGVYDEVLVWFGRNWEEAINSMCLEGESERLPDWR